MVGATAIGAAVVAVLIALAAAGGPFEATSDAWHSFKRGYEGNAPGNRLTGGLGSNRYDFYHVAWGRFEAYPITGIGGDNFRQDYLERRRDASETPRYPHTASRPGGDEMTLVLCSVPFLIPPGDRRGRHDHRARGRAGRARERDRQDPVVFVHGLWLLPSSWDRWARKFERAGYTALTPGWPDDPETVEEAAEHPEVFAGKTVKQVADHFEEVISGLKKKPAIVGTRSAASRSSSRGAACRRRRSRSPRAVPRRAPAADLRAEVVEPGAAQPGQPQPRGPADLRPVPLRVRQCRRRGRGEGAAYKKEEKNKGVTEIVSVDDRGHALTIDSGWAKVADTALECVRRCVN